MGACRSPKGKQPIACFYNVQLAKLCDKSFIPANCFCVKSARACFILWVLTNCPRYFLPHLIDSRGHVGFGSRHSFKSSATPQ